MFTNSTTCRVVRGCGARPRHGADLVSRGSNKWRLCERTIYDLPIGKEQIRREFRNSLHAPMHAVILAGFLYAGFFTNTSFVSFVLTGIATTIWAEIWHYCSHRLFHLRQLHWIHAEHHKSHLNSWLTAISFSFTEKLVFDIFLIGLLALADPSIAQFLWHRRLVHWLSHHQFSATRISS